MVFRKASEAVRNGRIGQLRRIKIGIGLDKPSGKSPAAMPVPENPDYESWLGSAPEQPYMEGRVHPQDSLDNRPGWITAEDFGFARTRLYTYPLPSQPGNPKMDLPFGLGRT